MTDDQVRDLHTACRLLWEAACDADPSLRQYAHGDTIRHGTRRAVDAYRCRCDACTAYTRQRGRLVRGRA